MNKYLAIILFLLNFGSTCAQSSDWEHLEEPNGLYLTSSAITKNNKLFVGGSTGIFSSANDGANWQKSNMDKYITSLIVTPTNEIMANAKGEGIFKSSDEGITWRSVSKNEKKFAFCDSMNNIYAFSEYGFYHLYRSSNYGDSWDQILIGSEKNQIFSGITNRNGLIYLVSSEGTFSSSDGGVTWANISKHKFENSGILTCSQDTLWYCSSNNLFTSIDGAKKWHQVINNKPFGSLHKFIITANRNMYILSQIYDYGHNTVLRSTNKGKKWSVCFENNFLINSIVINSKNEIFVTSEVVFKSTDEGINWLKSDKGLTNDGIPSLLINQQGVIFAATYFHIFRSCDGGMHWIEIDSTLPFKSTLDVNQLIMINDSTLFLVTSMTEFYKTTNNGTKWNPSNLDSLTVILETEQEKNGKVFFSTTGGAYVYLAQGEVHGYYYGGSDKYVINNEGFILSSILLNPITGESEAYVGNINDDSYEQIIIENAINLNAVSSIGKNLFLKDDGGNLYYSNDNGSSWHLSNLRSDNILNIVETKEGCLFTAKMFDGIFYSENGGKTWKEINENLKTSSIYSIELNPDGHLFVATRFGLFRSTVTIDKIR